MVVAAVTEATAAVVGRTVPASRSNASKPLFVVIVVVVVPVQRIL